MEPDSRGIGDRGVGAVTAVVQFERVCADTQVRGVGHVGKGENAVSRLDAHEDAVQQQTEAAGQRGTIVHREAAVDLHAVTRVEMAARDSQFEDCLLQDVYISRGG